MRVMGFGVSYNLISRQRDRRADRSRRADLTGLAKSSVYKAIEHNAQLLVQSFSILFDTFS
jgi:hypothetical protein